MKKQTTGKTYFGLRFIATGKETNGKYFLSETTVPAGNTGPPFHTHTHEDESFFVKKGKLLFTIDDHDITVNQGEFLTIEKGERHSWANITDQDAELLVIFAPAGIEDMFIALEEQMDSIKEVGLKYGTYFEV